MRRKTAPDRRAEIPNPDSLVTVRELHDHLGAVHERLRRVDERFGRVEKVLVGLVAVLAAPKLGGPDIARTVQGVLLALLT